MQVRYLIDPNLSRPQSRLAQSLIPALAEQLELKAEFTVPADLEQWQSLYAHFSRPLFSPQVQLFHGQSKDYRAHPIQWNILLDPDTLPNQPYDEVWFFSTHDQHRLAPNCPSRVLPALAKPWPTLSQAPIEIEGEKLVFCALPAEHSEQLQAVLEAYLTAFGKQPQVMLALYLIIDSKPEPVEARLIELVSQIADRLCLDLEQLNIGSWISKLNSEAYLGFLKQAQVLLQPLNTQAASEALVEGLTVVYLDSPQQTDRPAQPSLAEALNPSSLVNLESKWLPALAEMKARLTAIVTEVDFEARAAAVKQTDSQKQAGRKQKYSLFHSDYDASEMQARRNWHARYAAYFKACWGDVLDIGSGSGIFLEIMRDDLKQSAFGIDPDPDMIAVCAELKLQSLLGDERRLAEFAPESLGGIHASHVIEHIDGDRAIAMLENAWRVLRPGGRLLIRTPNWRNQTVRHEGFWLDITHIRPYPLALLEQIFQDSGFEIVDKGFEDFGWNDTYIVGQKPQGEHP